MTSPYLCTVKRKNNSYKFSKSFYDDAITQGKWWSKLYFKLLWGGVDDNEIARRVLSWIPDDFNGKMLDVPVGTAVFTTGKYKRMKQTDIRWSISCSACSSIRA